MKQLSTLTKVVGATAALALMVACQTVAINDAELAASKKEFLLAQSGFKVITVTTPKQQQAINGLAQYRVGREIQRQIVLCFSDCDQGQDLCRETKTVQRLSSDAPGAAGKPPSGSAGSTRPTADEPSADYDV